MNTVSDDAARQGPLVGLRVVELAGIGPGPFCAMLLGDLGADVVRVDRLQASELGLPLPAQFDVNARNRRSVAVDLKQPAGREVVLDLIDRADVLIEGFRPGVAERLGLGPAVCHARNARLVYGRMTGYGQTGPLAQAAGHDLNYIALSGALQAIGAPEQPVPPLNLVGDYGGGALYLAFGLMAALFERQSSGRGQVVDAAMVDGAASLMSLFYGLRAAGQWSLQRGDNLLDGGAPFYATYPTADGLYLAVAALEPKFFAALIAGLGLPDTWIAQQMNRAQWPSLREAIAQRLRTRTRDAWMAVFEGSDACVAPVLSLDEAPKHPHAVQRQAFVSVGGVWQPAAAPRFDRTPSRTPRPAPQPGQDTDAVLTEIGYTAQHIMSLRQQAVLR